MTPVLATSVEETARRNANFCAGVSTSGLSVERNTPDTVHVEVRHGWYAVSTAHMWLTPQETDQLIDALVAYRKTSFPQVRTIKLGNHTKI